MIDGILLLSCTDIDNNSSGLTLRKSEQHRIRVSVRWYKYRAM